MSNVAMLWRNQRLLKNRTKYRCAVMPRRVCQLTLTRITHQVSRAFDLKLVRITYLISRPFN